MPQPRKRLVLRASCPCSRVGHISDFIHTVTVVVGCAYPAANITDISCWDGLHIQFFLCWPSSARRWSDESSPLPGQWCTWVTVWYSGLAMLRVVMCLMVWLFTLNHAETTTVHTRLGTSICVTSWLAHLGDCLASVHLGGSWMCLLSYCWLHNSVEHSRLS